MSGNFDEFLVDKWKRWIDQKVWRYLAHFPPAMRQQFDDLRSEAVIAFLETCRTSVSPENGADLTPLMLWRCSNRMEYAMRSYLWSLYSVRDIHSSFQPCSLAFSDCDSGTEEGDAVAFLRRAAVSDDGSAIDVKKAVSALPPEEKKLVAMLLAGFTRAEAAGALHVHPSTVTRILKAVRDRLEKEDALAYSAS